MIFYLNDIYLYFNYFKSTLNILCKEKNVELVTWNNSMNLKINNLNSDSSNYHETEFTGNFEHYESQLSLFRQYLFKSSRYLTNQLFSENNSHINSLNDPIDAKKKILLIREIPNFFFHNNESHKFHDLLREFLKFSKSSLIFLFTNSASSSSSDSTNYYKLFPSDLRRSLGVIELTFNSMANSYMSKHLERICKLESFTFADKEFINNLVLASNGDLRHALNQLELISAQFRSSKDSKFNPNSALIKNVKVKRAANVKKVSGKLDKQSFESGIKDQSFGIFRGLGKVLYRKNLDITDTKSNNLDAKEIKLLFEAEKKLPKHLKKFYRDPLSTQPEEILSKIPMSNDSITLYLHQNYLELFSLKSQSKQFDETFDSMVSICDGFIHADQISSMSFNSESANGQNNRLKDISTLVAIRSILFNFNFDSDGFDGDEETKKTKRTSTNKNIWMPLYKPFIYKLIEMKNKRKKIAKHILIEESNQNTISNIDLNKEFFTTRLPFMINKAKINSTKQNKTKQPFQSNTSELNKMETIMLFSKFKPANSKTSFDQLGESSTADDDDFKNIKSSDINIELLTMKPVTINQNDEHLSIKSNYVYENNSVLSEIDENFIF
jgi:hypothetical protein